MTECECKTWAVADHHAALLGNGHNPACRHYAPNIGAVELLAALVKGIKEWAAEEDGVPGWLWDAFAKAVFITEGRVLKDAQV